MGLQPIYNWGAPPCWFWFFMTSMSKIEKSCQVQWRLKQGPPLAHKNWDFPSRLRVSSGIVGSSGLVTSQESAE